MKKQGFNIFTMIFGDPMAQQKAIDEKFNHEIIKLHDARLSKNKALERQALASMRTLSDQGSKEARVALRIANSPQKLAAMATKAGHDIAAAASKSAIYTFGSVAVLVAMYATLKK